MTETEKAKINIRELVLNALCMINEEGLFSNTVINDAISKYVRMDPRDKALFVRLIHGTLEYQIRIDTILEKYSSVKVRKMKPVIRNLLRMSVYQILYMDKIPDSAVCDEAVKLIKKSPLRGLKGFVNGVLRNISRDKVKLDITAENAAVAGHEALNCQHLPDCQLFAETRFSVKKWMYELLCETIGQHQTEKFLDYALIDHGVTIRETGTDNIRVIEGVHNIAELEGFREGKIIVQDLSASMPVRLAGIKEGDTVIDVCAAPGGKTIQASEKVGTGGRVISCDISDFKIARINENIKRLHITNVTVLVQDAAQRRAEFEEAADIVLADLPCSGIGTISKKPEIKNRLSLEDCMELAQLQKNILDNVCSYVKKGGRLVYSTCTLDHFENEDNTKWFIENHKDFELINERVLLPADVPQDGFYIAIFSKK